MTVRKNQAQLTADEKRALHQRAARTQAQRPYDRFVTTHNAFIMGDTDYGDRVGHRSPSFLPWHRRFLLEFESALQPVDPVGDAAVLGLDRGPHRPLLPLGRRLPRRHRPRRRRAGDWTAPSPTRPASWTINVRVDGRDVPAPRRSARASSSCRPRPRWTSVLAMPVYDISPWNSASGGFRNQLEGWRGANLPQPRARVGRRPDGHRGLPQRPGVLDAPRLHRPAVGRVAARATRSPPTCPPPPPRTSSTCTTPCGRGTT